MGEVQRKPSLRRRSLVRYYERCGVELLTIRGLIDKVFLSQFEGLDRKCLSTLQLENRGGKEIHYRII